MKLRNISNLMVLGTALTMTAVGCKTHPQGVTPINSQRLHNTEQPIDNGTPINNNPNPFGTTGNGTIPPNGSGAHAGWTENRDQFSADKVYFDFDKSAIKKSEQSKLDDVANFLKTSPDAAVRVEGNCDERGTEEYNRSLGERRAFAAREYLVRLGIDPGKVDTLSNG